MLIEPESGNVSIVLRGSFNPHKPCYSKILMIEKKII